VRLTSEQPIGAPGIDRSEIGSEVALPRQAAA
jgi:hypothetical protein